MGVIAFGIACILIFVGAIKSLSNERRVVEHYHLEHGFGGYFRRVSDGTEIIYPEREKADNLFLVAIVTLFLIAIFYPID